MREMSYRGEKRRKRTNGRTNRKGRHELSKEGMKAKRRRTRKRIVLLQRVMVATLLLAVIGGGGFAIIWNLPAMKLERQLDTAMEYTEEAAYPQAIEAYENALQIDSASVKAYRCMAGAYLDMENENQAKQVLMEGWENTQDEGLLKYYCTVILNEAVGEINNEEVSLDTVSQIVDVLEKGRMDADAIELLNTAYERLMESEETSFDFASYEQIMDRLFTLAASKENEAIQTVTAKYAYIDRTELVIPSEYAEAYLKILEEGERIATQKKRSDLIACLQKEQEIREFFADIFTEFDAGNYEAAKEFIITEAYTEIRDAFMNGTMEYWNGMTYIPVSRESVIIKQTENGWTFEYPDYKYNEDTAGVITIWGNPMKDNGVQRSCISYEPAKESASYYPHTEYVISYMYSNVQTKNAFEYMMNYHFETRTWTEEEMTTEMIGDWGGPYQWEKTY